MSKLAILDMKGSAVGEFELADDLIGGKGTQAVHDAIVAHAAGQRAGTASTKGKGEVAGSNRKPWKQKGTGRARAGYRRSPVWRGGGIAHGPHPRDFGQDLPKRVMRFAFCRAFGARVADGGVKVLDQIAIPDAKTKSFVGFIKGLGITQKALFIVDQIDPNLARASRNLPGVELVAAKDVNTYQVARYPLLVITRSALEILKARLEKTKGRAA